MPKAHQHHLEWTPSRLIDWARTISSSRMLTSEDIAAVAVFLASDDARAMHGATVDVFGTSTEIRISS